MFVNICSDILKVKSNQESMISEPILFCPTDFIFEMIRKTGAFYTQLDFHSCIKLKNDTKNEKGTQKNKTLIIDLSSYHTMKITPFPL